MTPTQLVERHDYLLDDGHELGLDRPRVTFSHLAVIGDDSTLCCIPRTDLRQVDLYDAVPARGSLPVFPLNDATEPR